MRVGLWRRWRWTPLVLLAWTVVAACQEPHQETSQTLDPATAELSFHDLVQDFDDQRGSLQLGIGWFEPKRGRAAATQIAILYFPPPPADAVELVARCKPVGGADAPSQSLTPILNGDPQPAITIARGWQEIRIPLPKASLAAPINTLELRFAHAVASDAAGVRARATLFERVAVVPRGEASPGEASPGEASPGEASREALSRIPEIPRHPERPHIFFYVIDTLRADALDAYGASRPTSPHIRRFARDAVLFERAWSPSSWTLPATASMLTGLYPYKHGYTTGTLRRRPSHQSTTLSERLQDLGYETLGISQSYLVSGVYGFDRGFEHFYLNDTLGYRSNRTPTTRWFLKRHLLAGSGAERPLFCFLHTVAPHAPYVPLGDDAAFAHENPGTLDERLYSPGVFLDRKLGAEARETAHMRALYDGEVLYADRQFGAFLDFLKQYGLYDQSVVVLTSDHGEEFYEHGGFDHGRTLYEELLHVPLLVKLPDSLRGGTRGRFPVTTLDIAPTLLALLGADAASEMDGHNLLNALDGASGRGRVVFAETAPGGTTFGGVDLTAAVAGDVKCIHSATRVDRFFEEVPTLRAFDLAADPSESRPLLASHELATGCGAALARQIAEAKAFQPAEDGVEPLNATEIERMKALGYID